MKERRASSVMPEYGRDRLVKCKIDNTFDTKTDHCGVLLISPKLSMYFVNSLLYYLYYFFRTSVLIIIFNSSSFFKFFVRSLRSYFDIKRNYVNILRKWVCPLSASVIFTLMVWYNLTLVVCYIKEFSLMSLELHAALNTPWINIGLTINWHTCSIT